MRKLVRGELGVREENYPCLPENSFLQIRATAMLRWILQLTCSSGANSDLSATRSREWPHPLKFSPVEVTSTARIIQFCFPKLLTVLNIL